MTTKPYVAKDLDCLVQTFIEALDHDTLMAYCKEYEVETRIDEWLDDDYRDETNRCVEELTEAMVKAYREEGHTFDRDINWEISKAIKHLGGECDILAIVGSYRDTLDDDEVLELLQAWNKARGEHAGATQ